MADQRVVRAVFQLHRCRWCLAGCAFRQSAVGQSAMVVGVDDVAALRAQAVDRRTPLACRRSQQHLSRGCAGRTERVPGVDGAGTRDRHRHAQRMKSLAYGPGTGGGTPAGSRVAQRLAPQQHAEVVIVAIHRCELEAHIFPVRVEFLCQQHRQCRRDALAHFRAMDAADDSAVRRNLQPCIERCAALTAGRKLVSLHLRHRAQHSHNQ